MSQKNLSSGLYLRSTFRGHRQSVTRIAWAPNGQMLASPSEDQTVRLWDTTLGKVLHTFSGHSDSVNSVAWSPDSRILASASDDMTIKLWDVQTRQCIKTLTDHEAAVTSVVYAPDGQTLASGSDDKTVKLWDTRTWQFQDTLTDTLLDQLTSVKIVTYGLDGSLLFSGSDNGTIQFWDTRMVPHLKASVMTYPNEIAYSKSIAWASKGQLLAVGSNNGVIQILKVGDGEAQSTNESKIQMYQAAFLEGHTDAVTSLSFSSDGRLIASKSRDGTVRLWRTDTWEAVASIDEPASGKITSGIAFHPTKPILATLGDEDREIRVWKLDVPGLLDAENLPFSCLYRNAKVVLVGDTGVGKSGLGLVLTGHPFEPTESTHGRCVWTLDSKTIKGNRGRKEIRETFLWDLAGQPGYRLIHQLHLNEVTLALVVTDTRSETDSFAGVRHWDRALRVAQHTQGHTGMQMKKFLISARIDRGGRAASRERIDRLVKELGFDDSFETSAKEGLGITELVGAIRQAIDWETLPKISSTDLFQEIKAFLGIEKEAGRILSSHDDLYKAFHSKQKKLRKEDIRAEFEICIEQLETQGLIRKLNFDDLVLLRPELIDAYASALVNAVKDEPEGLGSIEEARVRSGDFFMPTGERHSDREQERLLMIAMIEDLLRNETALRERTEEGIFLVFPSQSTRENAELPEPEQKAVIFRFEGPIQTIYATLAVRLSHSGLFRCKELWHNAITYRSEVGGMCGMRLRDLNEGYGELTLFFEGVENEETRFHFEEYVYQHLRRRALSGSLLRQRIFACPSCGVQFTHAQIVYRRQRGFDIMTCNVCDTRFSITESDEKPDSKALSVVSAMNRSADARREHEVDVSVYVTDQHQPRNPYHDVSSMHNSVLFVGRTKLLKSLFEAIANKQSISIIGSPRIGKSYLLQQMARPEVQRAFGDTYDLSHHLFVLIDLGEFLYKTSEDFFRAVSKYIIAQLREILELPESELELPDEVSEAHAFSDLLYQATKQGFYTVLLLDGFDSIVRNKSFDWNFLNFLRSLASAGEVSYVIASIAPLAKMSHKELETSPFFNIFYVYKMPELRPDEARQLVGEPSQMADFPFTTAELAWVLSLAGCHPFFIQRVCSFLFEEKLAEKKLAGDLITDLNKVKGKVYNDLLPHFNHMWDHLTPREQDSLVQQALHTIGASAHGAPAEFVGSELFLDFVREKEGMVIPQLNAEEVEKALELFSDPVALGASRLRSLVSVTRRLQEQGHTPSEALAMDLVGRAICEVLSKAWQRLRGAGERKDYAADWRAYNILYYRYFSYHWKNERIAGQLEISPRQYYCERTKAIETLLNALLGMEALAKKGME